MNLDGIAVRIGGKTYTQNRALAMGLIVKGKDGKVVLTSAGKSMEDSVAQKAGAAKARTADWRRRQGLPPEEPETTEDGILKPVRKPRVLKPKNVTPEGTPVEDEETPV